MMTKSLSKSRYTSFSQCPKNLWLKVYSFMFKRIHMEIVLKKLGIKTD